MRRNPVGTKLLWILTAAAGAAVGAVAIVAATSKSAKASTGPKSVWNRIAANAQTQQVTFPANSTFAISVPGDDANAPGIAGNFLVQLSSRALVVLQTYLPNQTPPAAFPSDNLGSNAYRLVGSVGTSPVSIPVDQSTMAWVWAGVTQ